MSLPQISHITFSSKKDAVLCLFERKPPYLESFFAILLTGFSSAPLDSGFLGARVAVVWVVALWSRAILAMQCSGSRRSSSLAACP